MANISCNIHLQEDTAVTYRKLSECYTLDIGGSVVFIHNMEELKKLFKALEGIKGFMAEKEIKGGVQ